MRARLLLALALLLSACGDPYSPVCGSPPPGPAPRTGAISVPPANPPPRDMGRPDLAADLAPSAPACGCPPEILGLEPLTVPPGFNGPIQVFGLGGWAAGIQAPDVMITPWVAVTGITTRTPNNVLVWIAVSPQAQGASDLRLRGTIVLRDALLVP